MSFAGSATQEPGVRIRNQNGDDRGRKSEVRGRQTGPALWARPQTAQVRHACGVAGRPQRVRGRGLPKHPPASARAQRPSCPAGARQAEALARRRMRRWTRVRADIRQRRERPRIPRDPPNPLRTRSRLQPPFAHASLNPAKSGVQPPHSKAADAARETAADGRRYRIPRHPSRGSGLSFSHYLLFGFFPLLPSVFSAVSPPQWGVASTLAGVRTLFALPCIRVIRSLPLLCVYHARGVALCG